MGIGLNGELPWPARIEGLSELGEAALHRLTALPAVRVSKGNVLFRPGDSASGFIFVLSGRVGVYLTGESGREILLYSVSPGETCLQTTLGLLGGEDYGGEAITETDIEAVLLPKGAFLELMDRSPAFRHFVFRAFATRLQSVTALLEKVAFINVEQRLAEALLERAGDDGVVNATHQELAVAIGSVREVVSRRLESLSRRGLVSLDRGAIRIADRAGMRQILS